MTDRSDREILIDDAELLALADGQLDRDPLYKARLERAVSRDPGLARRARAFRAQTDALRQTYDCRLAEPVPARLLATLDRRRPPGTARRALFAAAIVVLAAGAGSAGWLAGTYRPAQDGWALEALAETNLTHFPPSIAGAQYGAKASPAGAGQTGIPGWLDGTLSFRLHAPDLSHLGFGLAGRQEVEVDGVRALRLDYRASDGRVFNLFLRPRWNDREGGLEVVEKDGVAIASWMEGPLTTAVAARLPRAETVAIAEAVRRALREDAPEARAPARTLPVAEKATIGPPIEVR